MCLRQEWSKAYSLLSSTLIGHISLPFNNKIISEEGEIFINACSSKVSKFRAISPALIFFFHRCCLYASSSQNFLIFMLWLSRLLSTPNFWVVYPDIHLVNFLYWENIHRSFQSYRFALLRWDFDGLLRNLSFGLR